MGIAYNINLGTGKDLENLAEKIRHYQKLNNRIWILIRNCCKLRMQGDLMELFEQNVIQSYYKRNAVLLVWF